MFFLLVLAAIFFQNYKHKIASKLINIATQPYITITNLYNNVSSLSAPNITEWTIQMDSNNAYKTLAININSWITLAIVYIHLVLNIICFKIISAFKSRVIQVNISIQMELVVNAQIILLLL